MRKLDTNSYNKMLADKLAELEMKVQKNITPENIKYFPPELIKKVDDILSVKYKWADGNINGFEVSKINQMINYLKTFKTEFVVKQYTIDRNLQATSLPVPDGWDGRNSMVIYNSDHSSRGVAMLFPEKGSYTRWLTKTERYISATLNDDRYGELRILILFWRTI